MIKRYLSDEHSANFEVSPATGDGYKEFSPCIGDAMGNVAIEYPNFAALSSLR
ncbi:MAG: hypothetical protein ACRBB0_20415 [Pelagimonas sp.]|uniref:hypothetical protein n=1 Tax=Pelagimonas sp. TaxID=2073170 RepID=UPI003D6B90B6